MKRAPLIGVLGIAVFVFAAAWWALQQPGIRRTDPARRPAGDSALVPLRSERLRDFRSLEESKRTGGVEYTLTNAGTVLKIEVMPDIDEEGAGLLINEGRMNLEALYADALSPYPGDISNQVIADPQFRPQFHQETVRGTVYTYYVLFANRRLGYGATTADSVAYRSVLGWFHCASTRRFFKVRYFAPKSTATGDAVALFLSLRCS